MSLRITKAGLLDTVQDGGRYGYRHLGIGPGGAMDRFAAGLANVLLGRDASSPLLELHFPAAQILFEKPCVICVTGADFAPAVNNRELPLCQPVFLPANSLLHLRRHRSGARCYLSLLNTLQLSLWLGSYSTHLKASAGGFAGRRLQKGDVIGFSELTLPIADNTVLPLPWRYANKTEVANTLRFLHGPVWHWLAEESQQRFQQDNFQITPLSDRMGYRLQGKPLHALNEAQLVSSAVSFGTVQFLPNGQLVVLMADHQTTGGYPRIATVISTDLPQLAQKSPGDTVCFSAIDVDEAERRTAAQNEALLRLQKTCNLNLQNWLHAH